MSDTTEGLDLEALKGRVQHGVVAWRRDIAATDLESLFSEIERLRAEVGRLEARLQAEADVAARRHAEVTEERDRNAQRRMTRAKQVHEEFERLRAENALLEDVVSSIREPGVPWSEETEAALRNLDAARSKTP